LREFNTFPRIPADRKVINTLHQKRGSVLSKGALWTGSKVSVQIGAGGSVGADYADHRSHAGKVAKAVLFKVSHKLLSRIHDVMKSNTHYQIGLGR